MLTTHDEPFPVTRFNWDIYFEVCNQHEISQLEGTGSQSSLFNGCPDTSATLRRARLEREKQEGCGSVHDAR